MFRFNRFLDFVQETPEVRSGPWSAALATTFEDETVRTQVDQFMREQYQPYVTKLETDLAGTEHARALYNDLASENAGEAFIGVATALWGEEAAAKMADLLNPAAPVVEPTPLPAAPAAATPPAPVEPQPLSLDALPPEVRAVVESHQQTEAETAYQAELAKIKAGLPKPEQDAFNEREFALSVMANEGNLEQALGHYQDRMTSLRPAPAVTPAPETVGQQPAGGGGAADAPTSEQYDSLEDAISAFARELSGPAAPPAIGV